MKYAVFAVLLVAVGVNSLAQQGLEEYSNREQRIVTNQITEAIKQLSQTIRDLGLDPVFISRMVINEEILPNFVTVNAFVENFHFTGASNIAINNLDYNILLSRLRFDISLPNISVSIGDAVVVANVLRSRFVGELRGTWSVNQIRLSGEARVNVGIITGISVRSLSVNFRIQDIVSDLTLIFQENDYSSNVNTMFNKMLPEFLIKNRDEIDGYLSDRLKEIVDQIFNKSLFDTK